MVVVDSLIARVVLPLLEACTNTRFWSLYKEMTKLQSCPPDERALKQEQKIKLLLSQAKTNIPYWQKHLSSNNLSLLSTPVSTKQTYIRTFPDQITEINKQNDWQYLSSAGTTDRMTVVVNFLKRDYLRAAEHLNLKYATGSPIGAKAIDIPPSACNVVCGFTDRGPEQLSKYIGWAIKNKCLFKEDVISGLRGRFERQVLLKRQVLPPIDASPWETLSVQLDDYLDKIIVEEIEVIRALPHFLLWLATRAKQRNLEFDKLKTILPYGGLACGEVINRVESAFDAKFIDVYGTGEVGSIGAASIDSASVNVYSDMVCLEVVDKDCNAVAEGELGRVVVTDLNNFAMPIIRYAIGDVAKVIKYNDNSEFPQSIKIYGREHECIQLENGDLITPLEVQDLIYSHPEVINFKLEAFSPHLWKLSIVTITPIKTDEIIEQLKKCLPSKSKITVKNSEFLLPETSGKFLSIKQKKGNRNV